MNILEKNIEKMKEIIEAEKVSSDDAAKAEIASLERMKYRLSDAIREGAKVSDQAYTWAESNGNMCALTAAVTAAKARGYM